MKFNIIILGITVVFFISLLAYVLSPSSVVPQPPQGSLKSDEPSDTESIFRTAYFTTLDREEVMNYYKTKFNYIVHINHPPEDSYTLIRDQTRSSWIEELSNPLKNTIYINGYYPTKPTEQINRNGVHYAAKITIKYVPSNTSTRITISILIAMLIYFLGYAYKYFFQNK